MTPRSILQQGRFGKYARNGMSLTEGCFWTRTAGGYNLYRGRGGFSAIDFDHPVAVFGPTILAANLSQAFSPAGDYWFAVTAVSRFGCESETFAWQRIRTTETQSGNRVPDLVSDLRASFSPAGTIRLMWRYHPRLGAILPARFDIFLAPAAGEFNFALPAGQVVYRPTAAHYLWDSPVLLGVELAKCAVRTVSPDGLDDGSQLFITARENPDPAENVDEFNLSISIT